MAHSNYTVSTITTTELSGDSVANQTIDSSVILVITPDTGYVVSAVDFSIGSSLPIEVLNVVFSDTTTAGQINNLVHATVTMSSAFVMPSSNVELLIDIDGSAKVLTNSSVDITACIVDNVMKDGACATSQWPVTGDPISSTNLNPPSGYVCGGHFENTTEGSGITATSSTTSLWLNPLSTLLNLGNIVDEAATTTHTGSVAPNTDVTLFTRTFWTPPIHVFIN